MIGDADKLSFFANGYLLVPDVVPAALCEAVRRYVRDWLGVDDHAPETWPRGAGHGIVPVHHAQPLWDLRQHPRVHAVFARIYDDADLWVSFDRASFKAPTSEPGLLAEPIHWDGDPTRLERDSVQGLVYLTDTSDDQGAFCCVPGVYRDFESFVREHPQAPQQGKLPEVDPAAIRRIGGPQGSLLIWHRKMPHSSALNHSSRPRWVQYVAMDPAGSERARLRRIELYEQSLPPRWAVVQEVPGQQIPEQDAPAQLTELGRRLVGMRT